MSDKIVVSCTTAKELNDVQERINIGSPTMKSSCDWYEDICVSPTKGTNCKQTYWFNKGYTIISAEEYLKEGQDEVSEFKAGDRVECKDNDHPSYMSYSGREGIIEKIVRPDGIDVLVQVRWDRNRDTTNLFTMRLKKLATNKPTTTKEETMKENNTNTDVLAVFGSKVKGDELVVIDRHFDEAMLRRILMEEHHKAIQAECKDAETERLEAAKA